MNTRLKNAFVIKKLIGQYCPGTIAFDSENFIVYEEKICVYTSITRALRETHSHKNPLPPTHQYLCKRRFNLRKLMKFSIFNVIYIIYIQMQLSQDNTAKLFF